MGKRLKIGIIYEYYDLWIGGTYYILNLISALNKQEEAKKPHISIFHVPVKDNKLEEIIKLNYPFIDYYPLVKPYPAYSLPERIINKISKSIFKKQVFDKTLYRKEVDIIFPYSPRYRFLAAIKKKIYWIPD